MFPTTSSSFLQPNGLSRPAITASVSPTPKGLMSNNFGESHTKHYTQQRVGIKVKHLSPPTTSHKRENTALEPILFHYFT